MGKMIDQMERDMGKEKSEYMKKDKTKRKVVKHAIGEIQQKQIDFLDSFQMPDGSKLSIKLDDIVNLENKIKDNNEKLEKISSQLEQVVSENEAYKAQVDWLNKGVEDYLKKIKELSAANEHLIAAMYRITIANNI